MKIAESELIINADGSAFHIHLKPEELGDYVVLFGDPGRVDMASKYLSDIEFRHESREFVSMTGRVNGKRLTLLSTGIGPDNIDIVMNELDALANIDFNTREVKAEHKRLQILRIGTCGAIQPDIPLGSFILSHISIGNDGLLDWYAGRDEVCMLDFEKAYTKHVGWEPRIGAPYFVKASDTLIKKLEPVTVKGMTIAAPGFYGPQGRILRLPIAMPDMLEKFESFEYGGWRITNFEMEGAALAGMAKMLGHDAATVCCAIANRYLKDANTDYKPRVEELIKVALDRLTRA